LTLTFYLYISERLNMHVLYRGLLLIF